jgi:hypothetical protein
MHQRVARALRGAALVVGVAACGLAVGAPLALAQSAGGSAGESARGGAKSCTQVASLDKSGLPEIGKHSRRHSGKHGAKGKSVRKAPAVIRFARPLRPDQTITIAAVGDVLLHDRLQKLAATQPGGYGDFWADVVDILKAADVTFGNLEGPAARDVAANGKAVKTPVMTRYDGHVYGGYPQFNYHPDVAKALKAAGFDVIQTANNHAMDRHALGADRTIEALGSAGLVMTGTRHRHWKTQTWYAITPVKKNGKTYNIAWLACAYGTNDIRDKYHQVLNCYRDRHEVLKTVSALSLRPDVHAIILTPHWGQEYRHKPDKKQVALAHDALEAGATAVLGGHPHVMQPWERYVTKDGREGLIVYSLGNFVSNQIGVPRRTSVIALLGLEPDAARGGKLAVAAAGYVPIRMQLTRTKAGVRIAAEALDRIHGGAANRRHLFKYLPAANVHAASTHFWSDFACAQTATN